MAVGNASAADTRVEITGGADASGHVYEWRVTNRGAGAIVGVEFPHFGATLFFGPEGWTVGCTNLVNVGIPAQVGTCKAEASSSSGAIGPGRWGVFRMQCSSRGARTGAGSVKVRFADGSTVETAGVALPQAEPLGDRYVPLVGLGVLAVLFLLAKAFARRRKPEHQGTYA